MVITDLHYRLQITDLQICLDVLEYLLALTPKFLIHIQCIRGVTESFKLLVYIPDMKTKLATTPKIYRYLKNLFGKLDC